MSQPLEEVKNNFYYLSMFISNSNTSVEHNKRWSLSPYQKAVMEITILNIENNSH
jgi:hypothetical protein